MKFLKEFKNVKKTVSLAVLGLACIFAAFGQSPVDLDAAIAQASREINLKLAMGPRVALLNVSSSANDLSAYVLREMAVALERSRSSVVIARQDIDRALAAANLVITGEVNDAAARQIGRNLNARFVVTCSFEKTGDNYRFRTRLITVADNSNPISSTINVRENAHLQQLLGITPPAAAAPAAPAPAAPAPAAPVPVQPAPVPAPVPAPAPAAPSAVTYKVGDTGPAGGIIFYDKGTNNSGWRYLEAAPSDIPQVLKVATESIPQEGFLERAVGGGRTNTQAIMIEAAKRGGGFGWAAQACDAFTLNGFSDWFLPSRDELSYMYGNLQLQGMGDLRNEWYWSSTGHRGYTHLFWAVNMGTGTQDNVNISREYRVRPIRQF